MRIGGSVFLLFMAIGWGGLSASEDLITTVAGGFPNEDSPVTNTFIESPNGIVLDGAGNLIFVDQGTFRVRRRNTGTGAITTLAGTGVSGVRGDGEPAIHAWLSSPVDVAVDGSGNIFISDSGSDTIRRIDATTGNISTIAGTGIAGFNGDGGAAILAELNNPNGLAVGSDGRLYFSDRSNNRIRAINFVDGTINTFAAGMSGPREIVFDANGNLLIANTGSNQIVRVDANGANFTVIAGTGAQGFSGDGAAATAAQLNRPQGIAIDSIGNLFIADTNNNRIRRVDVGTGSISTIAGTGTADFSGDGGAATAAALDSPAQIIVNGSSLIFSDLANLRYRVIDGSGTISTLIGKSSAYGDGALAIFARLNTPDGLTLDPSGNLIFADAGDHTIRSIDKMTGIISTIAGQEGEDGFSGDNGLATAANLDGPTDLAYDSSGNLYICDRNNLRIRRVGTDGIITTIAGGGGSNAEGIVATNANLANPVSIAIHNSMLYIVDRGRNRVRAVDASGNINTVAGGGTTLGDGGVATGARLSNPEDLAFDGSGNMYIADGGQDRIRKVAQDTQIISTVAGNGVSGFSGDGDLATSASLDNPQSVFIDTNGDLLIGDASNRCVRKLYMTTGKITLLAGRGSGSNPDLGDGGPAIDAFLGNDLHLFADADNNILISDSDNSRIRMIAAGANRAPRFEVLPLATPVMALVGQNVTFQAVGSDPDGDVVSYSWDFDDGSSGKGTFVAHIFTAPGIYFVKVTISDGSAQTTSSGITIAVNQTAPATPENFRVSKSSFKFNFARAESDSVALSGTIPLTVASLTPSATVKILIGELERNFVVDEKGKKLANTDTGQDPKANVLSIKASKSPAVFKLSIKKQTLLSILASSGFINTEIGKPGVELEIPFAMSAEGLSFQTTFFVTYLAKLNGRGKASTSKLQR